jgi:hypothetical protein
MCPQQRVKTNLGVSYERYTMAAAQAPFEHQEFCLSEREVLALQHWAAKEGVSLASLLLTSFTVLLRRYQSLGGTYHFLHLKCLRYGHRPPCLFLLNLC